MQKLLFVVVTLGLSSYHITCSDKSSPYCSIYDASRCPQNIPTKVIKFSDLQSSFFFEEITGREKDIRSTSRAVAFDFQKLSLTFHNNKLELTNKAVLAVSNMNHFGNCERYMMFTKEDVAPAYV